MTSTPTIYQRFETAMTSHGLSKATMRNHINELGRLSWYYQRQPEEITGAEMRQYLVHLVFERKFTYSSVHRVIQAFRAFLRHLLNYSDEAIRETIPSPNTPYISDVYTPEEIDRLLNAKGLTIKHQTMLIAFYATGIRPEEVCCLRVSDILSDRMLIHVAKEQEENERYTVLSPELLKILRHYWRIYRPTEWLFPKCRGCGKPLNEISVHKTFHRAVKLSGVRKLRIHSIRNSFAVHMLESGSDLQTVQRCLGHQWIVPVAIYLDLMRNSHLPIKNPLGLLHVVHGTSEEECI